MSGAHYMCLLNDNELKRLVLSWLKEDLPSFDYGGYVVGDKQERAFLLCKSPTVVCGVPFFNAVFAELDCRVKWLVPEGDVIEPITKIAVVEGQVKNILQGERVALNCLSRASGIATVANRLNQIKRQAGWHGAIAGTRKTTPGFRMVEKYALIVGGVSTHRYDLSSMVMLKDNHIWSCGSVTNAVVKARTVCGFSSKIEVECRSKHEAYEAISAGADVIMLDNFDHEAVAVVASELKTKWPHIVVEASGGINQDNVSHYMAPNVDVISMGSLTHGYPVADFSLKIDKEGRDPANRTVTGL